MDANEKVRRWRGVLNGELHRGWWRTVAIRLLDDGTIAGSRGYGVKPKVMRNVRPK